MRHLPWALVAAAFLVACGGTEIIESVEEEPAPDSVTLPPDTVTSVPPTPQGEVPPVAARLKTDLDDLAVDAICGDRARALAEGAFRASAFFPIAGALEATARTEGK